ncbi:MAG TPA: class I SAM-dependent methyltransferase [Candidatus Saccharimonadales bacterium]|nr:class I SAM-dependent methyltransferase [Candidatus Saccharimonadales bacterium]
MAEQISTKQQAKKRADQYNDPTYNYQRYWDERQYEHEAEAIAIRKLLKGQHFNKAVDIGGGYGRLCVLLENYADTVILAEPSKKQLEIAAEFLRDHPNVHRELMQADDLKFEDGSIDLLTMVRVMHHLPDPHNEFAEISRVLSSDGVAIIEVANYAHIENRLKHWVKGQRMPIKPIDIRSPEHRSKDYIPFVNHNPQTVVRQLALAGLKVTDTLSVSNLRSSTLKKHLPIGLMLGVEKMTQRPLASFYFGPSIFLLVKKDN